MRREGAADEWADDRGDAEDGAEEALEHGALGERDGLNHDGDAAREDASRAQPETARPQMKATELGAAPQMAEPISKRAMASRKTVLVG